jgi:uncharacterized protein Veg
LIVEGRKKLSNECHHFHEYYSYSRVIDNGDDEEEKEVDSLLIVSTEIHSCKVPYEVNY